MDFLQKLPFPHLGRRDFDVESEMREQDAEARRAQRNLVFAIAVVGALAVFGFAGGSPAATALFGTAAVILATILGVITLVRRSIRRNFGDA